MSNKTLFQEAIADAKAVREAALANAKAALEETMTPRLQSMLAARLEENYDEEVEEGFATNQFMSGDEDNSDTDQNKMDEELDLSAILAELENESQLEEAKKKGKEDEEDEEEEIEKEETDDEHEVENEEEAEPTKVKDMTDEELTDFIQSIVQQEVEKYESNETPSDEMGEPEHSMEPMSMEPNAASKEEEININELLAELDAMYEGHEDEETKAQEKAEHTSGKEKKEKSEMKEAIRTINTLRSELNEVNLLNAKLIYVNKIFKSKSLTESQKIQVITSFDKATTTKEAKVVFESLTTALAAPKKPLKESLGFASRAAGLAPRKQQIVESNDIVARMQKLANIIK